MIDKHCGVGAKVIDVFLEEGADGHTMNLCKGGRGPRAGKRVPVPAG